MSLERDIASSPVIRCPSHGPFPGAILKVLRCPLCGGALEQDDSRLLCERGHSFDRARQGYVTLRRGERVGENADTPAMVAARDTLLGSGLYEPIRTGAAEMIAAEMNTAAAGSAPIITDLAGGTGYYLAGILDRLPGCLGICVDLSAAALKRAARSHPRAWAIGADLNRTFPLADASQSVVTSFFGPRNVPEIQRVLRPDGILVIVTPSDRHLRELIEPLGMVRVDPRKDERLHAALGMFALCREERIEYGKQLDVTQVRALVGMGPSAHHVSPAELESRIGALPHEVSATISVNVRMYGLRGQES